MDKIKKANIEGVLFKNPKINVDDRGFLFEIMKESGELFIPSKQTTFTLAHPGLIKAFHWHNNQTDLWCGVSGRARAVLYDLREESPTFECFQEFFLGEPNYGVLLIPRRVAHGYQVLGNKDFLMVYHTDQFYDPKNPDEQRIKFDETKFDWNIINR